ncbi:MAG: adenosylcobinamide-GDP ribazoletransferase [bacterium]|nr:adenosylcobinamide-GDP ribazoletransferase [bacterium]
MRELRTALTAIQFYTVLPVPAFEFRPEYFQRMLRYSGAVGILIGGAGALVFLAAHQIYPIAIAVVCSLIATVLLTGCLHEDGFVDFCEGVYTRGALDERLRVMRESRVGAVGASAAIIMILLRVAAIAAIPAVWIPAAIVVGHSLSRFASGAFAYSLEYARESGGEAPAAAGVKPIITGMPFSDVLWGAIIATASFAFFADAIFLWILPIVAIAHGLFGILLRRVFGGYTGDCLGAAQQIFEVAVYLCVIAIAQLRAF